MIKEGEIYQDVKSDEDIFVYIESIDVTENGREMLTIRRYRLNEDGTLTKGSLRHRIGLSNLSRRIKKTKKCKVVKLLLL